MYILQVQTLHRESSHEAEHKKPHGDKKGNDMKSVSF